SKEALLAADPAHYIIAVGGDMNPAATAAPGGLPPSLASRLQAVRKGNVHRISSDLLFRATPRLADGLILLAKALHP
ncbi:MAG: ABC transporter substrate-binding protein, partial [Cytophagales bacterium]|nr:ABC transporter substrate-binding protein [Armatimonadota bacterium]